MIFWTGFAFGLPCGVAILAVVQRVILPRLWTWGVLGADDSHALIAAKHTRRAALRRARKLGFQYPEEHVMRIEWHRDEESR